MLFEKQDYQQECVQNIVSILEKVGKDNIAKNNYHNLSNVIQEHYKEHKYNFSYNNKSRLDILMETGTGKTFTYLNTIFEIHKKFGKKHFIIVVPSIAIKLGVIQQINLTDKYFFDIYKQHLRYIDYDSKIKIQTVLNDFCDNTLSVLIMVNQAFNKKDNNLNKVTEIMYQGCNSPLETIASKDPIIILDEPHRLKGDKTVGSLKTFERSLFLRFGATYPQEKEEHTLSNVAYALDSISSFQKYLVKKIRVNTVSHQAEEGSIGLLSTASKKQCKIVYDINQEIHEQCIKIGEDIGAKTGMPYYAGITVTKIESTKVYLSNKTILETQSSYTLSDEEIEKMIETTIDTHFEKEEVLFEKGIKVLSLFFIPSISDFRGATPRVKTIFEKLYKEKRKQYYNNTKNKNYKKFLEQDFNEEGTLQVHQGYFSGDKGKQSDSAKEEDIKKGVNIILNEKETLLSLNEPLRFIFSVWALQEGWDNPNVYTICKLASNVASGSSKSINKDISRRQQVGRGLRIAVNKQGKRITHAYCNEDEKAFYENNTLDVVVSEKEKEFIKRIQEEIQKASFVFAGDTISFDIIKDLGFTVDDSISIISSLRDNNAIVYDETTETYTINIPLGTFIQNNRDTFSFLNDDTYELLKNKISNISRDIVENANKEKQKVGIREELLKKEFKTVWEAIHRSSKIVYKNICEKELIQEITEIFNRATIDVMHTTIEVKEYDTQKDEVKHIITKDKGKNTFYNKRNEKEWLEYFIREEKYPFSFMLPLFNKLERENIRNNPEQTRKILSEAIKECIHKKVSQNVSYEFGSEINISALQDKKGSYLKEIDSSVLGNLVTKDRVAKNFLFDTIVYDSEIEKNIMQEDPLSIEIKNEKKEITVFAKLPKIHIPTPYKSYSPDFAYLIKTVSNDGTTKDNVLCLIVESKGYDSEDQIPEKEKSKIAYAKLFFECLQKDISEKQKNISIYYKKRINKQSLFDILQNITGEEHT